MSKSMTAKYIFAIILVCFVELTCYAQPVRKTNINDFKSATWNTNGPKWDVIRTLMSYGLDVLAIQEAGSIENLRAAHQLFSPSGTPLPVCLGGFEGLTLDSGVREHLWGTGAQALYIYYFDRNVDNPNAPGTSTQRVTPKQNMAIVTRQRAEEIIVIPPEVRHASTTATEEEFQKRTFINRPVIGVRIANSVFFNIHPEPTRLRNEAPMLLNVIQNFMETYYPDQTYMVLGDFNRTPQELQPYLPNVTSGRFINIIRSGQNTRGSGELDYSIVGGPIANRGAAIAILASLFQFDGHKLVRFN